MNISLPSNIRGLSSLEAKKRLEAEGYNELPAGKKRSLFKIIIDILREPMILLLLACISIYIATGDLSESVVLMISIVFIIFISIYQENKTEKALEALKSLASPRALVWRDGKLNEIEGREIVLGDLVFVKEGDYIPADSVVISNQGLIINESLLTGESVPVTKSEGNKDLALSRPQGEGSPFAYSGTTVSSGRGIILVKACGANTEIGKIGKILNEVELGKTSLQKNFTSLVQYILIIAIFLCLLVFGLNILTRHTFIPSLLASITLAMAILPEEFPVVLAIFLSIGAWRLSQHKVLVRKMSVVESLGAATVLCIDKTGTLTLNKMKVSKIYLDAEKKFLNISEELLNDPVLLKNDSLKLIIKAASLSSNRQTFDPLEVAIKDLRHQIFHKDIYDILKLVQEYPLTSDFLAVTNVWQMGSKFSAYIKGAPELIISLSNLSNIDKRKITKVIKEMARDGLRIIGVAHLPNVKKNFNIQKEKLIFLGLLGFMDPVRPAAIEAIKECYRAGISVKMITGDYPETARSVACQIGLKNYDEIVIGQDFIDLSSKELTKRIRRSSVFARMMPEYKLKIISVLKKNAEIVVMTGDGVNDGPALKAADIGVAMGKKGTDVARESAGIILLDDNFASLVAGVKEGRKIFDNLQRAVVYLVAVHIPIAALSLLPIILGWPLIFFPAHIMFLELLVDPICSIVFEAEPASAGLMSRKPRDSKKSILNKSNFIFSLIQGFSISVFVFLIYYLSLHFGLESGRIRALVFTTLVIANILMVLSNRSWTESIFKNIRKKNRFLWPIIGTAAAFLVFAIYNPFLKDIFSFSSLTLSDWFWSFIFAFCPALVFEIIKFSSKQYKA